jgi:hypothetical protein
MDCKKLERFVAGDFENAVRYIGSSYTISARVRLVRQEAAGEVPTMTAQSTTAPWVVGVYAAGSVPPAGTGTEAWMRSSV